MREPEARRLEVVRTARYWVVGPPAREASQLWFVLHGYQQLARSFLRRFQALDDGTRHIVAPEALSRFYTDQAPGRHGPASEVGASWMTREEREDEIADYVNYLDTLARVVLAEGVPPSGERVTSPHITVVGFSQGVATAARWTVLGKTRPHRLVLWGDHLPPDLDAARAREAWATTEVVLVRGDTDGLLSDRRLAAVESVWLAEAAPGARTVRYPGGHEIDQRTLAAVASSP